MSGLGPGQVARALGLEPPLDHWLARLAEEPEGPEPVVLDAAGLEQLLVRLAVPLDDLAVVLETVPDPDRSPAWWWIFERCHWRLARAVGEAGPAGWWPQLPLGLGASARTLWIHVYCSVVPLTRAWHRAEGVSDEISWATLADLGRHVRLHRLTYGSTGIDEPWWMMLHLRGELFECGRLQYDRHVLGAGYEVDWYDDVAASALGVGFRAGDPVLGVHIPESGPLAPELCEASIAQARAFFASHFVEPDRAVAVCTSWLLDEQLADVLPGDANIVAFQRRFQLLPGWVDGDGDVLSFVFHRRDAGVDDLEPTTSLERAVVQHLRSGRHWRLRTGWFAW